MYLRYKVLNRGKHEDNLISKLSVIIYRDTLQT